MAYAYGTVTDFNDFMTKLMEFASGTNASGWSGWTTGGAVPSGQQWSILTNTIPTSGTAATTGIAYIQGPGSTAGDDITVGFQTYTNVSDGIYGVEIKGLTAYDSTLSWTTQPGVSPSCWVAGKGGAMDAWFWVNGRRIMAAMRIDNIYDICFQVGFFLPYGTHNQYPYPLIITGSMVDNTQPYTRQDYGHSCIPDPGGFPGAYFRFIDGTWQPIQHYNQTGIASISRSSNGNQYAMYPHYDQSTNDGAEYNGGYTSNAANEQTLFQNWTITNYQFSALEIGSYMLFPVVLNSATQLPGQLDGIYAVPGNQLAPGDTVTISGTVYDVFHNCWRSSANEFFCIPRI